MRKFVFFSLTLIMLVCLTIVPVSPIQARQQEETDEEMSFFDRQCLEVLKAIVIKKLPRDLYMANMDTLFFGLRGASIDLFRMTENNNFYRAHPDIHPVFMRTRHILVHINPLPLFLGQVLVTDMNVDDAVFQIVRDEKGEFNFDDLSEAQDSKLIKWLHVKELFMNDAVLRVLDNGAINKPIRYVIDDVDVAVKDFQIGKVFSLDIKAASPDSLKQNIFMYGEAGPMTLKQKNEEIPLDVDLQVVNLPITPYNRYVFPKGAPIIPVSGDMNVDYHMTGNFWSGVTLSGSMGFSNVVLQSTDGFTQGEPIDVRINLNKPMRLSLKKGRLDIPELEMMFNGNKFLVSGKVDNVEKMPEADLHIRTGDVDIDVINAVYPFITESLPEELSLNGHYAMDFHLSGTQLASRVKGKMDLTKFSFGLGEFFQKPPQIPFLMDFSGIVNAGEVVEVTSTFAVESCLVGEYNFIEDIITTLLKETKNRELRRRLLETYSPLPHQFTSVAGTARLKGDQLFLNNVRMNHLHTRKAPGVDVVFDGVVDFADETIDIKGNVTLSTELTRKMLMADPATSRYLTGKQIVFGFQQAGALDNIRLTILSEPVGFAATSGMRSKDKR